MGHVTGAGRDGWGDGWVGREDRIAGSHVSAIQLSNQSDSKKRIRRSSLPELSSFCTDVVLRNMDAAAIKERQVRAMHADSAARPAPREKQDTSLRCLFVARQKVVEPQHLTLSRFEGAKATEVRFRRQY